MSETTAEQTAEATEASEQTSTEAAAERVDGEGALGDAGKKALDAMKADLRAAKDELAELRASNGDRRGADRIRQQARDEVAEKIRELEEFKAKAEGREKEYRAEQERHKVESDALTKANERILKAELRAAAKGKLSDPSDAFRYPEQIDLSSFDVGEDGSVDAAALESAVDNLISKKPYLAVQDGKRFQGDPDAGARKESRPSQLTKSDLERMTPEAIDAARKEGRLDDLMGVKR